MTAQRSPEPWGTHHAEVELRKVLSAFDEASSDDPLGAMDTAVRAIKGQALAASQGPAMTAQAATQTQTGRTCGECRT